MAWLAVQDRPNSTEDYANAALAPVGRDELLMESIDESLVALLGHGTLMFHIGRINIPRWKNTGSG